MSAQNPNGEPSMSRTGLIRERKRLRRKSRRVIKPMPILVFWKGESGRYEADICDMSIGGCFINTNGDADDGERISLEIPTLTPTEDVIQFNGSVIPQGRKLKGFGVRFGSLSKDQQSLIAQLMVQSNEQADRRNSR